jgi:hypothetical protein
MSSADLVATMDPEAAAERTLEIVESMGSVERGLIAFEDLELDVAAGELDLAINGLLGNVEHLGNTQRLALNQAIFALATTSLFEGQGDMADGLYVALALLSPTFRPEKGRYPSNVTRRFKRIIAAVGRRRTGVMRVESKPPGAAVFVDGEFRGTSPIDIDELVDDQHAVVLERRGYRTFGTLNPVTAGRKSLLEVDLLPTRAKGLAEALTPRIAEDAEHALVIGRRLKVDRLATLVAVRGARSDRVYGLWLDVEASKVIAPIPSTNIVDSTDVAAATIVGAIALAIGGGAPPSETVGVTSTEAPEPFKLDLSFTRRWWFWAVVGGIAVVGATSAAVVAGTGGGPSSPPRSGHILGF